LRLLASTPYSFTIEIAKDNPGAFEQVQGDSHTEKSNDGKRNPHLDVVGLFNTTVRNPRYDSTTAQIIGVVEQPLGSGKPNKDCPEPTGRVLTWNSSAVDLELDAPKCAPHWVTYTCTDFGIQHSCSFWSNGGGSNVEESPGFGSHAINFSGAIHPTSIRQCCLISGANGLSIQQSGSITWRAVPRKNGRCPFKD
jgi:hypothetical protein